MGSDRVWRGRGERRHRHQLPVLAISSEDHHGAPLDHLGRDEAAKVAHDDITRARLIKQSHTLF